MSTSANPAGERVPVTVIIPTHSHVEYIEESIRTVLNQTIPPAEVLVVVDNPTPAMRDLVPKLQDLARVIVSDKQLGTSGARNAGIDAATQPYIAFNDDDDMWEPFRLERGWKHLRANPELDGVYAAIWWLNPDGTKEFVYQDEGRVDMSKAIWRNPGYLQTLLVRTDVVRKIAGFDTTIRSCEDHDFAIRMVESGAKLDYLMDPVVIHRRHGTNQSDQYDTALKNHQKLVEKHKHLLVQVYGPSGPRRQRARNMRLYGRQKGGVKGRLYYYAGVVLGNFETRIYMEEERREPPKPQ